MFTSVSIRFKKVVAFISACAMVGTTIPAGFVFASDTLLGPDSATIAQATPTYTSAIIDASAHENLNLSFNYNAEGFDAGDSFTYGWRASGGSDNDLGPVNGITESGTSTASDEIGSVSIPLPSGAQIGNLEIYVKSVTNSGSDSATLSNITVTGDPIPPPSCSPQHDVTGPTNIQNDTTGEYFDSLQDALADCDTNDGDTLSLSGDVTLTQQVTITRPITLDGNGHTITSSFAKTDSANNSAIGIIGTHDVTIEDVFVDGTGGTDLHGINVYESTGVLIKDTTVSYERTGVLVNGSEVTVENIHTNGNTWNGMDVDQGSGVTSPAHLTVNGTSQHGEASPLPNPHIFVDDTTKDVTVTDTNNQYNFVDAGNARAYTLKVPVPTGLRYDSPAHACDDFTNVNYTQPKWDAVPGVVSYDYQALLNHAVVFSANYSTNQHPGGTYGSGTNGVWGFQVRSVDAYGQKSDWSPECSITLDTVAPAMPVHLSPADNSTQNVNDFYFDWTDVPDAVEYEFQSSQNPAVDGDGALTTGVWNNKAKGAPDRDFLASSTIHSYGANGTWYWQVRAIDAAGNKSHWTAPWKMTISLTPDAPAITGFTQNGSTLSCGSVTDTNGTSPLTTHMQWTEASGNIAQYAIVPTYPDGTGQYTYYPSGSALDAWIGDNFGHHGDGTYSYTIKAQGTNGLWSASSATCTLVYDTTPPEPPDTSAITSPGAGDEVSGVLTLGAHYADENHDNNDGVQWAVRAGTCAAGTSTVWGNVDGHNDAFTWDHSDFTSSFDTTLVANGSYCFIFNPSEDSGNTNQRLTQNFTINNSVVDTTAPAVPTGLAWTGSDSVGVPDNGTTNLYAGTASWNANSEPDFDHYVYTYWNDIASSSYNSYGAAWTNSLSGTSSNSVAGVFNQGEGTHHFCVKAVDTSGNTSACSATFTITYSTATSSGGVSVAPSTRPALSGDVIYDAIPAVLPSNSSSLGYQAQQTAEFGDKITFATSTGRNLLEGAVTLSSWACESGAWEQGTCVTTPGATFTHPITLNLYNVANDGSVGTLIASRTQTFEIPYRPSANPECAVPKQWKDTNGDCFNGYNYVVVFDLTGITVPDSVIYGIAYNTQTYGTAPIGSAGPYNSLNVSLNTDGAAPYIGTDVDTDQVFWDTQSNAAIGFASDNGWSPYKVAVTFTAVPTPAAPTNNSFASGDSSSSGGTRVGFRSFLPQGEVLGASTTAEEEGDFCEEPYITDNLGYGRTNNPEQVTRLQTFLNNHMSTALAISGIFDLPTRDAVMSFQQAYASDILTPWGITNSTGFVYYTTRKKINELVCGRPFPLTQAQLDEINGVRERIARGDDTGTQEGEVLGASTTATGTTEGEPSSESTSSDQNNEGTTTVQNDNGGDGSQNFFVRLWHAIFGG